MHVDMHGGAAQAWILAAKIGGADGMGGSHRWDLLHHCLSEPLHRGCSPGHVLWIFPAGMVLPTKSRRRQGTIVEDNTMAGGETGGIERCNAGETSHSGEYQCLGHAATEPTTIRFSFKSYKQFVVNCCRALVETR